MSAIDELQAFLRKSSSLVYPQDVLPYVDAIEEENEELRNAVELDGFDLVAWHLFQNGVDWVAASDYRRLKEESDRLRELVKSMYYDLTNMTFPPDWVTDYEADMRELGIEVDG